MPRYLQICGEHLAILALESAPKYFPSEREMIYTAPTITIAQSVKTPSSSSAPLITKNKAKRGDVHLSEASIRSWDSEHMLQNTVPSIIHVSSDENAICTGPIWKSIIESDAVRNTTAIVRLSLFVFELNNLSSSVSTQPIIAPNVSEHTISTSGFTIIENKSASPTVRVFAMPNDTANTIRPTASSSATIGKSSFVSGPFALYWRTTISVAAGAVAVAIAPSVMICGTVSLSGIAKYNASSARSTSTVAANA